MGVDAMISSRFALRRLSSRKCTLDVQTVDFAKHIFMINECTMSKNVQRDAIKTGRKNDAVDC